MTLAIDKLHDALKAVPDDIITKHALADAYQTLAFAEWQNNLLQNREDGKNNLNSNSNSNIHSTNLMIEKHQSLDNSKGFELYRSLLCDETHTRCSKLRLSYRGNSFINLFFLYNIINLI